MRSPIFYFNFAITISIFIYYLGISPKSLSAITFPCTTNCPELSPGTGSGDWPMAGGNLHRTSWNSEEVRGRLYVEWYRPIEAYVPYKIQPIAADGRIYVATAKGLYAFNALNGSVDWVYPTELPLGNSPTFSNSIIYVGGYDKKIHALNATTGQSLQGYVPYEAGAGFDTSPLIVNNTIYAGNRDGYMYALDATTGALVWRFQTGSPISFSAAYKNNHLYFASNDSYAYALNAQNGSQIWRSEKFQGQGFYTFWPVIYTEKLSGRVYVIFGGSENYRNSEFSIVHQEWGVFFPNCADNDPNTTCTSGELIGSSRVAGTDDNYWTPGTFLINATKIIDYHRQNPNRRSVFILDALSGIEFSFDYNHDGQRDYAPFTYSGVTHGGTRYPSMVNPIDGILYNNTQFVSSSNAIPRGDPVGWQLGSPEISRPLNPGGHAIDEPMAMASGGRLIYWNLCCDREAGVSDITLPYDQPGRSYAYVIYNFLTKAPDYRIMYDDGDDLAYADENGWQFYSGKNQSKNGVYSNHTNSQSPSIPYQDKIYMLKGNALLAWSPVNISPQQLPLVEITNPQVSPSQILLDDLRAKLIQEIQKILDAGPLRPGYHPIGIGDNFGINRPLTQRGFGEIYDYFQNPSETIVTLISVLPHLPLDMAQNVRNYLEQYYGPGGIHDFTRIVHLGWDSGASRDSYPIPLEVWNRFGGTNRPPLNPSTRPICTNCGYWTNFPPYSFYAAWKYAQVFGNAASIYDAIKDKVEAPPTNPTTGQLTPEIIQRPYLLHLYIAGYQGYLELEKLAGLPENTNVRNWLYLTLNSRLASFSKDTPFWPNSALGTGGTNANYLRTLSVARNFMFLTPELAQDFEQHLSSDVRQSIAEYQYVAPYWFVSKFDGTTGEGTQHPLYDSPALFQAKAWILKEPREELVKYLDVPAFERGDLFYIQNLVATIEASSSGGFNPDLNSDSWVDFADYSLLLKDFNSLFTIFDFNRVVSFFGSLLNSLF